MLPTKSIIILSFSLCLHSCKPKEEREKAIHPGYTEQASSQARPALPYKYFVQHTRQSFAELKTSRNIPGLQQLLYSTIAMQMPLYWTGTTWDFNGVSRTPGEGSIACGYFITTLLEDAGFKLNRVRLAQEPSSVLIKSTCTQVKNYGALEDLKKYLQAAPANSVCILGLDFHTGFVVKGADSAWFFHSNYIRRSGVTKELVDESGALKASKTFMIGSLTANSKFLLK